jgi:hypothetical protein
VGWGLGTSERGEVVGKRGRRVNMAQKMYTYVCKCKNGTRLKPFQEWGEEGIKERDRGGEFKYDIFDTL